MTSLVSLATAAASFGLTSLAHGHGFDYQAFGHTYPGVLVTVPGDFNGDAIADFALVRTSELVLIISPSLFESVVHVPAPPVDPNDLALRSEFLGGAAIAGAFGDDLLVGSTLGVLRFSFHDASGRWSPAQSSYPGQTEPEIVGTLLTGSPTSLERVNTRFLPVLGDWLVVGTDNANALRLGLVTAANGWIGLPNLTAPSGLFDLTLADLDSDGLPEVAMAHSGGVDIRRYDDSLYFAHATVGPAHFVDRIRFGTTGTGAPQEGLAVVAAPMGGPFTITTMGGGVVRAPVASAGISPTRADVFPSENGEGFDLVLLDDSTDLLRTFRHTGVELDVTTHLDRVVSGPGALGGLHLDSAGFADLDGDSDVDIFIPSSSYAWGGMMFASSISAESMKPTIDWSQTGWADAPWTPTATMIDGILKLRLNAAAVTPAWANALEISFWSTEVTVGPDGPEGETPSNCSYREVHDVTVLDGPGAFTFDVEHFLHDDTGANIPIENLLQTLFVRYIEVDDNGLVVEGGPCRIEYLWRGGPSANPAIETYVAPWAVPGSTQRLVGLWRPTGISFASEVGNSRTGSCTPGHGPTPPSNPGS